MTKEYQPKKSKTILPRAVYMMTIYQIRDYYRLKEKLQDTIDGRPDPWQVRASGYRKGSSVEIKAIRRERDRNVVTGIDKALESIPEEYRSGVWWSVQENRRFPDDAAREKYSRYKSKFILMTAVNVGFI